MRRIIKIKRHHKNNSCVPWLISPGVENEIKNNAWVTVNNFFGHEWGDSAMIFTSDEVTSENHCRIASRVTKKVIHGNECIILFITRYFMSWTHISPKNYHRVLISPLLPRTVISDLVLCRHHNWSVTSLEGEILVLWRHIRRLRLHAPIGAEAICTSE